jgi:NADPH:quinone reductase-like Zn-dependent oxidoreductase
MYPGDPGDPGGDCSGVVIAAGEPSSGGVQPGDAVFGLATGSLGSHVVASALTLVPVPANVSAEAAATMPTVFITVDAALSQVAALRPGERLLLPAAAGGVGLAGIQLAQALGAEALATAGSPAKRSLLRSLGVGAVASSRGLGCFGDLALATGGAGADVVLNSLTSPGMVGGALALLRRGGRLVEIGKRDVWSGAAVAAQRPDVAYSLLAVDFMSEAGLHAAMVRLSGRVAAGTARPLPGAVHDLRSAAAALRQLSQARHVGKVVVRASGAALTTGLAAGASANAVPASSLSGGGGAVLVLGGAGTLGSLMVKWLAESGVGAIPVASRSGRLTAALGPLLAAGSSAAHSAAVTVAACDGSAAADTAVLASSLGSRPLLGVLHAGGVLADAVFSNQSAGGVRKVAGWAVYVSPESFSCCCPPNPVLHPICTCSCAYCSPCRTPTGVWAQGAGPEPAAAALAAQPSRCSHCSLQLRGGAPGCARPGQLWRSQCGTRRRRQRAEC